MIASTLEIVLQQMCLAHNQKLIKQDSSILQQADSKGKQKKLLVPKPLAYGSIHLYQDMCSSR